MYIIIVCIYDLGLFATEEDQQQQQPQHSHWIATGFPPTWQQEEILSFLHEQGWEGASVIGRHRQRKANQASWWLKAKAPTSIFQARAAWE